VLVSIDARNNFSRTGQGGDLARANDLRRAGLWVGGAAIVPRVISVLW